MLLLRSKYENAGTQLVGREKEASPALFWKLKKSVLILAKNTLIEAIYDFTVTFKMQFYFHNLSLVKYRIFSWKEIFPHHHHHWHYHQCGWEVAGKISNSNGSRNGNWNSRQLECYSNIIQETMNEI